MKRKLLTQILTTTLAASLLCGAAPASALADREKETPNLNPDYVKWEESGSNGTAPPMQDFSYLSNSYAKNFAKKNSALYPERYDLREYGLVDSVVNIGENVYYSSVAATSSAMSSVMNQFPQERLSPIHAAWFSFTGKAEEESYNWEGDPLDKGGNVALFSSSFAAWKGPVFEEKAPVNPQAQQIPDESMRYDADFHIKESYYLPQAAFYDTIDEIRDADVEIMKQLLMKKVSLSAQFNLDDAYYNKDTYALYCDLGKEYIGVAALIVGWDDNYSKYNFNENCRPENNGAWLVRNCWGDDWGDDGYFWLSYEDKSMICEGAITLEDKNNYTKNYQHDIAGWCYSMSDELLGGEDDKKDTYANIFTAESDEQLEAIGFFTTDVGTKYSISVYTNVDKDNPSSGTLALSNQTGYKEYAGYQTVELKNSVALKKGERFSIVVTAENPEYKLTVPMECCITQFGAPDPVNMGNYGESYILTKNGWKDVYGTRVNGHDLFITNVCVKGFTNPLPKSGEAVANVRYSKIEGPVAHGDGIELEALGTDEIFYSVNNSDFQKYTEPIKADFTSAEKNTISAYAVKNGKQGNTVTKTFTKLSACLTDCKIEITSEYDKKKTFFDTRKLTEEKIEVPAHYEKCRISAQSADTITVNGEVIKSNGYTSEIPLKKGEETVININVAGEGKNSSHYKITVYRSMLDIDYKKETVSYDSSKYTVFDKDGNKISVGDSITHLISTEVEAKLNVITANGESFTDFIPKRIKLDNVKIDYKNMRTLYTFSKYYIYSNNADMSNSSKCNESYINVTPGEEVYILRTATEMDFESELYRLVAPDNPPAPELNAVEITSDCIKLDKFGEDEQLYFIEGVSEEWQSEPEFKGLKPDTEYKVMSYLVANNAHFSSKTAVITVKTKADEEATQPPTTLDEPDTVPPATEKPPVIEPSTDSATSDETAAPLDSNGVQTGLQSGLYICVAVMLMFALITAIGVNFKKKK